MRMLRMTWINCMATDSVPVETVLTEDDGEFNIPVGSPTNMKEKLPEPQFSGKNLPQFCTTDSHPLEVTWNRNIALCNSGNLSRATSRCQNKFHDTRQPSTTFKEQERIRQRNMMKLKRQDPFFRAVEREKQRSRMKARRQDPVFRDMERERQRQRMKMKRQDPLFREKERERQKYRMQIKRQDPVFKEQEKARGRSRSQTKRLNSLTETDCQNRHKKAFDPCSLFGDSSYQKSEIKSQLKEEPEITSSEENTQQQIYKSGSPITTSDTSSELQSISMGSTAWNPASQPQNKSLSDKMSFGYYKPTASDCSSASSFSYLLKTTASGKTLPDISTITLHSSMAFHTEVFRGDPLDNQSTVQHVASLMNPLFQSHMSAAGDFVKLSQQKPPSSVSEESSGGCEKTNL
ncbi:putative uncharacterized protein DDB_G0271982 [Limulus polyphemus]|uniref:Uncharacterized protein n=1 Tax=Limulus polyphemus TaxID=6850 RepID=A0ABM1TSC9_LIMPO|nr:putative uncharacterized protein DDB_G0271982 [Limulus polyphemus]